MPTRTRQSSMRVMPDLGCWVSPRCLDCPLPRCLEELPQQQREALRLRFAPDAPPEPPEPEAA